MQSNIIYMTGDEMLLDLYQEIDKDTAALFSPVPQHTTFHSHLVYA